MRKAELVFCLLFFSQVMVSFPRGYKTVFMFNSTEHEISTFHKKQIWSTVVECLTRDRGATGSSLTRVTVYCPWARLNYPCSVVVQPRKTRSNITEKWLTGTQRIKSNKQTNKQTKTDMLKKYDFSCFQTLRSCNY